MLGPFGRWFRVRPSSPLVWGGRVQTTLNRLTRRLEAEVAGTLVGEQADERISLFADSVLHELRPRLLLTLALANSKM